MAIPVSNPPPRYEPGPARPGEPSARIDPIDPRTPGVPRSAGARGCLMLVGLGGAIGCVVTIGLALSFHSCLQIGESEVTRRIATGYRAAAVREHEEVLDQPDLRALEQLGDGGDISIIAFGILNNRFNDAFARDGTIDANELHHGMELVHDIAASHGSVDIQRYPDGR